MPLSPTSAVGLARGIALQACRQTSTALKRSLPSSSSSSASSPPHFSGHHKSFLQLQQPQRGFATETTQATPVPPPPPSGRNRVYPAVLLITFASVGYVIMTPDDENIDTKIMEAVKARLPPKVDGEEGQAT
ncbi:Hypothetical protein NocV09_03000100 [Nannochloropsis oceanica]